MRRKDVWQRSQLLQKIESDTAKAYARLTQRSTLQEARRQARPADTLAQSLFHSVSKMSCRQELCMKPVETCSDAVARKVAVVWL